MTPRHAVLSSVVTVFTLAGTSRGYAQDPVAPAPQHNPENISQINGQLVEVGNHNTYDYSYKRFNVASNPVSMILGMYGIQGSVALNSMVALRGDLTVYTQEFDGVDLTLSAAVYFKHMYKGLFVEPGILLRTDSQEYAYQASSDTYDVVERQRLAVQTLVGYHWMWDSGLNLAVAAGAARFLGADEEEYDYEEYAPMGYMRFGYAF